MTISIKLLQIATFYIVYLLIFTIFLTNLNIKEPIFFRFGTFLVLLLREFFYAFPLVVTFVLNWGLFYIKIQLIEKVYISRIFLNK